MQKKAKKKEIISPYTLNKKNDFYIPKYVLFILVGIVLLLAGYFVFLDSKGNDFSDSDITYVIRR